MTVWGLFLLAALVMKAWPETALARSLQAVLIDRPFALLGRIRRRHLIFLIVGLAVMYGFAEIGMPHLAVAAAMDVSALVDGLITIATLAALNRSRAAWHATLARLPRPRRTGPRRRRAHRPSRRLRPSSNDDDGHRALAPAA